MGYWGVKLYDNDCAADIKDRFQDLMDAGISPNDAIKQLEADFQEMIQDPDDGPIAQAVLADLSWKMGCLDEARKEKVLSWLEAGGDLPCWAGETQKRVEARERALEKLCLQLLAPMPNPKRKRAVPGTRRKQLQWKPHEIYALPLRSEEAVQLGLQQEYALIYIQGASSTFDGYRNPKVWIKITQNGHLPQDSKEFDQLDFLRISCTRYANRFGPFHCEEKLPPDFRQTYQPDEWGLLPEYTMEIMQATGHHPPETLQLLGVFENVQPPAYEYFRYKSALGCTWKFAEGYILGSYSAHSLHLSPLYGNETLN